jgi:cation diffusion facilitator CzcD-associated flavoprotein CzcO
VAGHNGARRGQSGRSRTASGLFRRWRRDDFSAVAGRPEPDPRHGAARARSLPKTPPWADRPALRPASRNLLGFPADLSGEEVRRAVQAGQPVSFSSDSAVHRVTFDDGDTVAAKAVILATGARYNRLPLDRLARFEGVGVYYAATQMEAQACQPGPVAIVGGGNSAGQAALFLSRTCTGVRIIIRGDTLGSVHVPLPDRPD